MKHIGELIHEFWMSKAMPPDFETPHTAVVTFEDTPTPDLAFEHPCVLADAMNEAIRDGRVTEPGKYVLTEHKDHISIVRED